MHARYEEELYGLEKEERESRKDGFFCSAPLFIDTYHDTNYLLTTDVTDVDRISVLLNHTEKCNSVQRRRWW